MLSRLSARQREVMLLAVEGLSNKEIGRQLNISDNTVKVHLHNIYLKLEIHQRTKMAVLFAKSPASQTNALSGAVQTSSAFGFGPNGAPP